MLPADARLGGRMYQVESMSENLKLIFERPTPHHNEMSVGSRPPTPRIRINTSCRLTSTRRPMLPMTGESAGIPRDLRTRPDRLAPGNGRCRCHCR